MVFSMIFPFYCFSFIFNIPYAPGWLYSVYLCKMHGIEGHITNHQQGYDGENMGRYNPQDGNIIIICTHCMLAISQLHFLVPVGCLWNSQTQQNLIGGLEHFLLFHILGIIIPTDFHIFRRGRSTTNQKHCASHGQKPETNRWRSPASQRFSMNNGGWSIQNGIRTPWKMEVEPLNRVKPSHFSYYFYWNPNPSTFLSNWLVFWEVYLNHQADSLHQSCEWAAHTALIGGGEQK